MIPRIALSVRQPWAWAIIHAGKNIENRGPVAIRKGSMRPGRIAVHAAKGMTRREYEAAAEFIEHRCKVACPPPAELVRGGIIGAVTVDRIVTTSPSPWFMGPRGLVLREAEPCLPVPALGALGFFEWREEGELEGPKPWMVRSPPPPPPGLPLFGGAP